MPYNIRPRFNYPPPLIPTWFKDLMGNRASRLRSKLDALPQPIALNAFLATAKPYAKGGPEELDTRTLNAHMKFALKELRFTSAAREAAIRFMNGHGL